MNEHFDPLEAELAALAPQPTSLELKARIAKKLFSDQAALVKHTVAPRRWGLVLAAGLAACLVIAVVTQRSRQAVPPSPPEEILRPTFASALDESLPTVWSYHRAVFAAPGSLDALLDRHARDGREPPNQRLQVNAFPMTSTDLESLLGDI